MQVPPNNQHRNQQTIIYITICWANKDQIKGNNTLQQRENIKQNMYLQHLAIWYTTNNNKESTRVRWISTWHGAHPSTEQLPHKAEEGKGGEVKTVPA
jgi:hypothetical protein